MGFFNFSRLSASAVLAAALGLASLSPGKAHANDDLVRVLVNVADIIHRSGQPYYHDRDYGRYQQVVVVRDRYQRPTYYRYVPRNHRSAYRSAPPYGNAYGYHRNQPVRYYDRDDRRYRDDRRDRDDRHYRDRDHWNARHDDRRHYKGKKKYKGRDRWDD